MFGWTIEVSTCAYTYLHVPQPYIISTYIPFL